MCHLPSSAIAVNVPSWPLKLGCWVQSFKRTLAPTNGNGDDCGRIRDLVRRLRDFARRLRDLGRLLGRMRPMLVLMARKKDERWCAHRYTVLLHQTCYGVMTSWPRNANFVARKTTPLYEVSIDRISNRFRVGFGCTDGPNTGPGSSRCRIGAPGSDPGAPVEKLCENEDEGQPRDFEQL